MFTKPAQIAVLYSSSDGNNMWIIILIICKFVISFSEEEKKEEFFESDLILFLHLISCGNKRIIIPFSVIIFS